MDKLVVIAVFCCRINGSGSESERQRESVGMKREKEGSNYGE
jgi:hypothetical protein